MINLNAGEKIKLACPAYLSNGGTEYYSHLSSKKIPEQTPLTYELEILECEPTVAKINKAGKKDHAVPINEFNHKTGNILENTKKF